jgi:tetratricopeptide (TPR) repeat protein
MKSNGFHSEQTHIDWDSLKKLSSRLSMSGVEPGTVPGSKWQIIDQALMTLTHEQNWRGILRLRNLFDPLFARDTMTGLAVLQQLDQCAMAAARQLGNKRELGHLLEAKGHNLHRQGYHLEAIKAFDESAKNYREIGDELPALKNYYMTSLCYRALGNKIKARQILEDVLDKTNPDDPWRANPLQVMAWLMRDEGRLASEELLRQALALYRKTEDADMLVAGALADLGEIVGITGRLQEAKALFEESLFILSKHQGQYDRQEARVLLKYSELLMHRKDYLPAAMQLLNRADDKVGRYGHYYDILWQIELAKAFIFLRQGQIVYCLAKIRSVFRIRRHLGLPNSMLIKHVSRRYTQRLFQMSRK